MNEPKYRKITIDIEDGNTVTHIEKDNEDFLKQYYQLQSNWNSLREYIISVIDGAGEELNTIIHTTDIDTKDGLEYVNQCSREFDVIRKNLEIVLDKMNELEGKDKK